MTEKEVRDFAALLGYGLVVEHYRPGYPNHRIRVMDLYKAFEPPDYSYVYEVADDQLYWALVEVVKFMTMGTE